MTNDTDYSDLSWEVFCEMSDVDPVDDYLRREGLNDILIDMYLDDNNIKPYLPGIAEGVMDFFASKDKEAQLWEEIEGYLRTLGYYCVNPVNADLMWWRGDGMHQTLMDWAWNGEALPPQGTITVYTDFDSSGLGLDFETIAVPLGELLKELN